MDNSQKALTVGGVFTFALVVALLVQSPTIVQSFEVPDDAYIKNESGVLITYYPIKIVSSTEKSTSYYWTKLPNQTVLNCFSLNPEKFIFEANLNLADVKAYPVIARERINKTLTLSNEICEMQSEEYQECEWNEEIQEQFCSNKTSYFDVCHDEEYEESYEYGYRIDAGIPQEVNTSTQMEWIISIDTDRASKNTIWNYSLDLNSCGIPQTIIVDPEVTACAELNESNGIYNLTQNVSINDSTCFTITAPNVTLDCNGYSITGIGNTLSTYGVYTTNDNTTIKNCNINNFDASVRLSGTYGVVKDSNITTNYTATGYGRSILVTGSSNLVSNSYLYEYNGGGTYSDNGNDNTIVNSTVVGNSSVAMKMSATNSRIINVTVLIYTSSYGIYHTTGSNLSVDCQGASITGSNSSSTYGVYSTQLNTTVKNCNISNFSTGVYFNGADNGTIDNVSANTTGAYSAPDGIGIYIYNGANYNTIANSNGYSKEGRGIYILTSSNYNSIINSTGTAGTQGGIYILTSSNYNSIINSTGTAGTYGGIYLESSSSNSIINSTATASSSGGIYIYSNSNYNSIINSTGTASSSGGIYIYSNSNNNSIINSTGTATTFGGIFIRESSNNNSIINSTGTSGTEGGIYISTNSGNNSVINTTATAGTYGGIIIRSNSNNNSIINSQIRGKDNTYGSLFIYLNSTNNSISNCTINGMGATRAVTLQNNASNNLLFNNTIFNATNSIYLDANSGSNTFYYNSITGTTWVSDSNGLNHFNSSGIGNIYYFANGTPSWEVYNLYSTSTNNWADGGTDRPFNATTVGGSWSGSGEDWHPYSPARNILVYMWNGTDWSYYNASNTITYRCTVVDDTYPVWCQPTRQNNATNQPIFRVTNNDTTVSRIQQIKTSVGWDADATLYCGTNTDPLSNINVTTSYGIYRTDDLEQGEHNYLYCHLRVFNLSESFQKSGTITFRNG